MKTTFKTLLCTSLLLAFVSGCGKDQKSGSAPAAPLPVVNPILNNVNTTGQAALTNIMAWYSSTTENSTVIGPKTENRSVQLVNQNNCKEKSYLGGLINFQTCFGSTSSNITNSSTVVNVLPTTVKSSNVKLAAVFNSGLNFLGGSQTQGTFGFPVYTLDYSKANGHIMRYKIDTGLHSSFNPVEIYDTELGRLEWVTNPNSLR